MATPETPEQTIARLQAELEDARKIPYKEAAEAAVAAVQPADAGAGADAGASLGQMSTEKPEPLPHEAQMDALMEQMRVMTERMEQMGAELASTKRGYAAAVAKLGPPEVAVYGQAIYDKLVSFRNAHPDLLGHFDQVIEAARPLHDASVAVIAGTGHVSDVIADLDNVVNAVDRFITRTHPRRSGKPIDFSALAGDLEDAVDAAAAVNALAS